MSKKIIYGFFLLFFMTSCGSRDLSLTESPFGFWVSNDGFSFEIFRNGKYKFCNESSCQQEKWSRTYDGSIDLKNLNKLSNSESFLILSGLQLEKFSSWPEYKFDPKKINKISISPIDRYIFCKSRPCVIMGYEDSREYFFYKVKEY